jgi:hypothetical protein
VVRAWVGAVFDQDPDIPGDSSTVLVIADVMST